MKNAARITCFLAGMLLSTLASGESLPSAPDSAQLITVAPAFEDTVQQLSAGSFRQRQAAVKQLQQALADALRQLLKDRTAASSAPLAKVLGYHAGLSRWLQTAITVPEPDSDFIAWGLQPAHLSLVSRTYSSEAADRLEVVHQLAGLDDPHARVLLATLIGDLNRDVHLAALDVVWDSALSTEIIDALWARSGVESLGDPTSREAGPPPANSVNFHGHTLFFLDSPEDIRLQDGDLATDILVRNTSEYTNHKLELVLNKIAEVPSAAGYHAVAAWSKIEQLLSAHHSKVVTALLYKIATLDEDGSKIRGAPKAVCDRRVAAIAGVVITTGQDLNAYHLQRDAEKFNNAFFMDPVNEEPALAKLKAWWKDHGSDYAVAATAATQSQ